MMRTFLPAQALRTSKKTGGLNSRPSCVCDAVVCLLALSRFVSRFGRARANDRFAVPSLRSSREACSARAAALARRRRRALCGRLLCGGHCDLHGPAHPGSSPRPSPWLRPSANVSRPEAPFLRCTRPVGGPTTTTNGNVSHLKERLCLPRLSAMRRHEPSSEARLEQPRRENGSRLLR